MKKILGMVIAGAIMLTGLVACQAPSADKGRTPGTVESTANTGKNQGITTNQIKFTELKDEELPVDIAGYLEQLKAKKGFAFFKTDDGFTIMVLSGEKLTGGYVTKVTSIEDIEGITKITVDEKEPGKDDVVTEAITYPHAVIQAKSITENFNVVNQKGEKYELLTVVSKPQEMKYENVAAVLNGQIDGNSIEMKLDKPVKGLEGSDQPMAFRLNEEMKNYFDSSSKEFKGFKEGDKMKISFYKNEYGQLMLTLLEKA